MSRECGKCTLCCRLLGVHELDKKPLEECIHCIPGISCKIYDTRPNECRNFDCSWLLEKIPEELKPNKYHVVLTDLQTDIKKLGIDFLKEGQKIVVVHVDPLYPNSYKRGKMKDYLNSLLANGIELVVIKNNQKLYMKWGTIDQDTPDTENVSEVEKKLYNLVEKN